jgi:H+/Cl- antiporter ClcA
MSDHAHRHRRLVHDELHPLIYETLAGLAIWFVLSVWLLFDRGPGSYVGLTFAMISVFFIIVVGIPVLIWLTWRRNAAAARQSDNVEPFQSWSLHRFKTWTGEISGREAATQILLPIVAVSIGITIFGLVFLFDVPHLG